MSPCYLAGKYPCRFHPQKSNCTRLVLPASCGDNEVDHAVCLIAEFQMQTVLSNANGQFYTTMIYPCFSRGVWFSIGLPAWWRFGLCSSGSSLVSQWRDAPLMCEFQMWQHRCKQIEPHWFQEHQMCFWWMWSTISRNYFIIYSVQMFRTANFLPQPSCTQFSKVYWLLIQPVNHRQQPVTSRLALACYALVSAVFSRKIYHMYWLKSFLNLNTFCFNFYDIFICTTCKHFTFSYFDPKYFV